MDANSGLYESAEKWCFKFLPAPLLPVGRKFVENFFYFRAQEKDEHKVSYIARQIFAILARFTMAGAGTLCVLAIAKVAVVPLCVCVVAFGVLKFAETYKTRPELEEKPTELATVSSLQMQENDLKPLHITESPR